MSILGTKEKKFIFIFLSSCTKTEEKDSRKILYIVYFTASADTRRTRETSAVRCATVTLLLRQGKHSRTQHKIATFNELDKGVRSAFVVSTSPTRFPPFLLVFCFFLCSTILIALNFSLFFNVDQRREEKITRKEFALNYRINLIKLINC